MLWEARADAWVQSFADVPVTDAGVDTVAFLEASQGVLGLFGASAGLLHWYTPHRAADLLGSAAFAPVQRDIKGNIAVRPPAGLHCSH